MLYNIFNTEKEALIAQDLDFKEFQKVIFDNNGYDHSTTCWAIPIERITDSKWLYEVCPYSSLTHTTIELPDGWADE